MKNRIYVGLASLALAITGLGVQKTGWFVSVGRAEAAAPKQTMSERLAQAAARHARCQPRHWRALMLQLK